MKILVKTSLKLLFRMKGFWFFLLLSPILSTVILRTKQENLSAYENIADNTISELESLNRKVAYFGGKGKCVVKVYDGSESNLSEYILNKLCNNGLFTVCRVRTLSNNDTAKSIEEQIEKDGFNDRMGAAIVLDSSFDTAVLNGNFESALKVYILSEDDRIEILKGELKNQLNRIHSLAVSYGKEEVLSKLAEAESESPRKEVVAVAGENERELTNEQTDQKTRIGYAFAIMVLGFVFCGIFIAHIAINEQKDCVYTRIRLADAGTLTYFLSKFVASLIVSVMVTAVMAVCTLFIDVDSMGIGRLPFILMIFMMGVIFSSLSVMLGIIMGDVMSSNVAAFTVWSLSSMLSGMYFPIKYTGGLIKTLAYLMPQKWFFDCTEMIFFDDKTAYIVLLCVTVAYLAVIISLGSLGLKIKKVDEWGSA